MKLGVQRRMLQVLPPAVIVAVWVLRQVAAMGIELFMKQFLPTATKSGLFVAGWVLGWNLVDLDQWVKRAKLTGSWVGIFDQWKTQIRSIITIVVLVIMGVWLVSSSGSALGWGTVVGLQVRLLADMLQDTDFGSWYTAIARTFTKREHAGVLLAWTGLLLLQGFILLRG